MSLMDLIPLVISVVSLGLSIWAAVTARRLSMGQLRLSNRAELHRCLLEIDKALLHDPGLGAIFKDGPPANEPASAALAQKQDAFIQMHLTVFELSFAQFKELQDLTPIEREISAAWDRYIAGFFKNSPRAVEVWGKNKLIFYESFVRYIDALIAEPRKATGTI